MGAQCGSCVETCADSVLDSCEWCDAKASAANFNLFKLGIEGKRIKVGTNPLTEPEVWVTVHEVQARGDASALVFRFSKFALQDVNFKVDVELKGTKSELAGKAAVKGAQVAMEKLHVGPDDKAKALSAMNKVGEKLNNAVKGASTVTSGALESMPGSSLLDKATAKTGFGKEEHKVKVDVTVDMNKDVGVERVDIVIKDFKANVKLLEKVMQVDKLRDLIERGISQHASNSATNVARQHREKVAQKLPCMAETIRGL